MRTLWKRESQGLVDYLYEYLGKRSDSELRALVRAVGKATTTNCSWVWYDLRGLVSEIAQGMLTSRRRAKKGAP